MGMCTGWRGVGESNRLSVENISIGLSEDNHLFHSGERSGGDFIEIDSA